MFTGDRNVKHGTSEDRGKEFSTVTMTLNCVGQT